MGWTWRLHDAAGKVVHLDAEVPSFSSQSDAESWLGEIWRELVQAGASQASLYDDDHLVYGPMSLLSA
jgi:hypothetical protein